VKQLLFSVWTFARCLRAPFLSVLGTLAAGLIVLLVRLFAPKSWQAELDEAGKAARARALREQERDSWLK
jgi:hypothetical protein